MFLNIFHREPVDNYQDVSLSGARPSSTTYKELTEQMVSHIDTRLNVQGEVQHLIGATVLTSPKDWPSEGSDDANGNSLYK